MLCYDGIDCLKNDSDEPTDRALRMVAHIDPVVVQAG